MNRFAADAWVARVWHDPPWQARVWVTTAGGRTSRLGVELERVRCDEAEPTAA